MSASPLPLPPLDALRARSRVVAEIRAFFAARDFVEVDTPVAISAPAPEAAIDAVPVTMALAQTHDSARQARYLQTSPELAMKRLVAHGLHKIYQLAPVFRDGDHSPVHRPEFRLLEWYRSNASFRTAMTDCEALVAHLLEVARALHPDAASAQRLARLQPPYRRVRMDDAFVAHANIDLARAQSHGELAAALRAQGVHHLASDSWADMFHRVFVASVEPALLACGAPFFLTHFPAPLASLAQCDPDAPAVAERFELYAGGLELANGFQELRCGKEQRQRFDAENQRRVQEGKAPYPLDEAYLACLSQLPPTAGTALGLERLLLALFGAPDIDAISFLPWSLS